MARVGYPLAVIALAGGAGALVSVHVQYQRTLLLVALLALIVAPVVVRVARGRFDLFEPITIMAAALLVMFGLRPIAHLAFGDMSYRELSLEPGFDRGLLIALIGVAALYAGYTLGAGRALARRVGPLPGTWHPEMAVIAAGALVLLELMLMAAWIQQLGGLGAFVDTLGGRAYGDLALHRDTSAYLFLAPYLTIPAALLLLETSAQRHARLLGVAGACLAVGLLLLQGPRGERLTLLLLIVPLILLPYLRTGRRPRLPSVLVVAVVAFVAIHFLQVNRGVENRKSGSGELLGAIVGNPGQTAEEFLLGPDTEMFPALVLVGERFPSDESFHPGVTVVSLLTNPIPREVFPDKPYSADAGINDALFPGRRLQIATSQFGGFYYDAGLVGVVLGALLAGVLARFLWEYLRAHPGNAGVRLVYAASLPLLVMLVRGDPTETANRLVYLVAPLLVVFWLVRRQDAASAPGTIATLAPRA